MCNGQITISAAVIILLNSYYYYNKIFTRDKGLCIRPCACFLQPYKKYILLSYILWIEFKTCLPQKRAGFLQKDSWSFQLPALKSMDTDCIAAENAYTERWCSFRGTGINAYTERWCSFRGTSMTFADLSAT